MPRRKNLDIRVTIREKGGKNYLRFRDPLTGSEELRLVKGKSESQWQREAGAWERELKEDASKTAAEKRAALAELADIPWVELIRRFNDEHLMSLAESTDLMFQTVINAIAGFELPGMTSDIDASYISRFQAHLRSKRVAEATATSYLNHFKVILNWAKGLDLLAAVPKFPRSKRARKGQRRKPMKGRPATQEEFELILEKATEAVPVEAAQRWQRLLKGLWWGGLRLEEALELSWDRLDKMRVDLDSQAFPVLRIIASSEKGGKDRTYPIAPEFVKLLQETPVEQRSGLVFPLQIKKKKSSDPRRTEGQVGVTYASARITEMGRLANVVTNVNASTGEKHYAGAHDFRRAFGTRWARRVKPLVLKEMMRHESLETTMDYYVDLDADETAAEIWAAWKIAVPRNSPAKRYYPRKYRLIWKMSDRVRKAKQNESGE